MMLKKLVAALLIGVMLSGCASAPRATAPVAQTAQPAPTATSPQTAEAAPPDSAPEAQPARPHPFARDLGAVGVVLAMPFFLLFNVIDPIKC